MKKTKNYKLGKWIINFSKWEDYLGFFILPTLVLDRKLPLAPELTVNRLSLYFLKYRFKMDFGRIKESNKEYNWDKANLNEFLNWWRKETKKPINKKMFEEFLDNNPKIKDLLVTNNGEHYYTKRYLFKKFMRQVG